MGELGSVSRHSGNTRTTEVQGEPMMNETRLMIRPSPSAQLHRRRRVGRRDRRPARRRPRLRRRQGPLGVAARHRSRCSTTIPTGSARSSAISATSRRRWSRARRTPPRASSSSTRTRPTWAIPRPASSRSASRRASRSSRSSRWAAPTCSTSPSARARRRRTSRASKARPSCSAAPAGSRSPTRC